MEGKYRIFFVDDEPWVLTGLSELFNWADEGFTVAGQYTNAPAALEDIVRLAPDAVITDITMPRIDGLQLMERCHQAGYCGAFILLTGYEEFAYARRAIEQKAYSYLLKPIDREEVRGVIRRVRKELDEEKLRFADMSPEEDWTEPLTRLLGGDCGSYRALAVHGTFSPDIAQGERLLKIREGKNRASYLLAGGAPLEALRERWRRGLTQAQSAMGLSEDFARLSLFPRMARHAEIALHDAFLDDQPCFYPYRKVSRPLVEQAVSLLLDPKQKADARQLRDGFLKKASMNDVVLLLNQLSLQNAPPPGGASPAESFEAEDVVMLFSSPEDILSYVLDMAGANAAPPCAAQNAIVQEICDWIGQQFASPIRLRTLSGLFHVSETYICELFRKHKRQTLTHYVLSVRMDKAASLLLETPAPLADIAEAVGYADYAYFGRVFKRYFGVSPLAYRRNRYASAGVEGEPTI